MGRGGGGGRLAARARQTDEALCGTCQRLCSCRPTLAMPVADRRTFLCPVLVCSGQTHGGPSGVEPVSASRYPWPAPRGSCHGTDHGHAGGVARPLRHLCCDSCHPEWLPDTGTLARRQRAVYF